MSVTTELRPMVDGIAGVEAIRCFEVPAHRPIVYRLDHYVNHDAGTWYDDFAIMDGRVDPKMTEVVQNGRGTRRLTTRDSMHVIVVRNECRGTDEPVVKTIISVHYMQGIEPSKLEELKLRIQNELS